MSEQAPLPAAPTPSSAPPPRSPWLSSLGLSLLYLVAIVVVQIFVGIVFSGAGMLYFMSQEDMEVGEALSQLGTTDTSILLQGLATLPSLLLVLLVTRQFRKSLDHKSLRSLGLQAPTSGWPRTIGFGIALGALAVIGMVGLIVATGGYRFTGISYSWSTWLMFPALLGAAFLEELIMRGYVLQKLMETGNLKAAILLSSLFFWLFHALNPAVWSSPWAAINLFGAGILLALAYLASGNLWFPTAIHFAWNAAQGLILELPISGIRTDGFLDLELTGRLPSWLTGGAFGFEGSVLATLSEIILILGLLRLWRRNSSQSLPSEKSFAATQEATASRP